MPTPGRRVTPTRFSLPPAAVSGRGGRSDRRPGGKRRREDVVWRGTAGPRGATWPVSRSRDGHLCFRPCSPEGGAVCALLTGVTEEKRGARPALGVRPVQEGPTFSNPEKLQHWTSRDRLRPLPP